MIFHGSKKKKPTRVGFGFGARKVGLLTKQFIDDFDIFPSGKVNYVTCVIYAVGVHAIDVMKVVFPVVKANASIPGDFVELQELFSFSLASMARHNSDRR